MHKKYCMFVGKFQLLNPSKKEQIDEKYNQDKDILLAVQDITQNEHNKLTFKARKKMLRAYYPDEKKVKIILVPDVESVNFDN